MSLIQSLMTLTPAVKMSMESHAKRLSSSGQESLHNLPCPFCEGGETHETCFSVGFVQYPYVLWYKCWRNKCSKGGRYFRRHVVETVEEPSSPKQEKKIIDRTEWVQLNNDEFLDKYGLTKQECMRWGIYSVLRENYTLAYTIWSPDQEERGCVLRCINGEVRPKSLTFNDSGSTGLSWYLTYPERRSAVLVEDIISAIKVSRHTNAVALNGVYMNPDRAMELRKRLDKVYFALDPDARLTMLHRTKDFGGMFDSVGIFCLEKDPKDMTDSELQRVFGS